MHPSGRMHPPPSHRQPEARKHIHTYMSQHTLQQGAAAAAAAFVNVQDIRRIHQLLEQVDQGAQVVATEEIPLQEDITVPRRDSDLTAWVNVIHGCNERCTYCVVPNTRGNEQSRLPKDIRVSSATF